jgi:hypothetical protein
MVLVNECGWCNTRTLVTLDGASWVLEFGLSFTRVYETDTLHSHLRGTIRCDESWGGIDDIRIVETETDVVVRVIKAVERDLDRQYIGLRVHRDLALDSTIIFQLGWLIDGVVGWVSEPDFNILAGRILADEVSSSYGHHLMLLVLQWSKRWLNLADMWRVIESEAVSCMWGSDINPVLVVE